MNSAQRLGLASAAAALLAAHAPAPAFAEQHTGKDWTILTSDASVADTKDRLVAAAEKAGAKVFAVVDHQAGATAAGLELAPTTLVIFGNPKIGTPLMQDNPMAGIDLPIRVLIWDEQGRTRVGALSAETIKDRYGLESDDSAEALEGMKGALDKLLAAAAGQ